MGTQRTRAGAYGSKTAAEKKQAMTADPGDTTESARVATADGTQATVGVAPDTEGTRRILTVDVGNTTTRFGVMRVELTALGKGAEARTPATGFAIAPEPELLGSCELTTRRVMTADEASIDLSHACSLLDAPSLDGTILSCVVPTLTAVWQQALANVVPSRPLTVGPGLKSGIKLRFNDPAEVGSDRIADAVAARATYGAPAIVVDLGTTTNFEAIDASGAFAGGVIAPGIMLGASSLSQAAARLPIIEIAAPASVLGRNTRAAMQSGVVFGEVARIDGLLDAIAAELGAHDTTPGSDAPSIVITGMNATAIAALLRHPVVVDDTLTLRGLARIWAINGL